MKRKRRTITNHFCREQQLGMVLQNHCMIGPVKTIQAYQIREALTKFSLEDTGALSDARMVSTFFRSSKMLITLQEAVAEQ